MTIQGLSSYLSEKNFIKKESLDALRGCKIGIDGFHWLKVLYDEKHEPFQMATGGTPISLALLVQTNLKQFKDAGITPVFVFNGINCVKKERSTSIYQARTVSLKSAWGSYEKDQKREALMLFSRAQGNQFLASIDTLNALFELFNENDIEFLRAPYLAWGQLSYMSDAKLVNGVMGDEELLMFDIPKVIFSLNFDEKTFQYVEKKTILTQERISSNQFLDAALLSGSYFFKGFSSPSPFQNTVKKEDRFKTEIDNIKGIGSAKSILTMNSREDLTVPFLLNKYLIMHHPVLDFIGNTVVVMNRDALPRDFEEIVGERLPEEIYFLICHGILSPQLVGNLVNGVFYEPNPLFDSLEYKEFINTWKPIYTSSLNYLTSEMNDYFKHKNVMLVRYNSSDENSNDTIYIERKPVNVFMDGLQFQINEANITKYLQQQKITYTNNSMSLGLVLNLKPTLLKKNQMQNFTTPNEVKTFIHLKVLETLGYIKKPQQGSLDILSSKGKVLSNAKTHIEQTLVLVELAKMNILTASWTYEKPYAVEEKIENEDEILLITRILSLVPLTFRRTSLSKSGWTGLIKLDLAIYYSIVKLLQTNIAHLYESLLTAVYMSRSISSESLSGVMSTMRDITGFSVDHNNIMGILAYYLLSTPEDKLSPKNFKSMFLCCQNPYKEFREVAIPFWQQSYAVLKKLTTTGNEFKALSQRLDKANELFEQRINKIAPQFEALLRE
ncbi:XPG domain-containing protein [Naegleria gruberi]|uniref:XPG domain-containing protein n=1 Tax=Naegleria gruberi TaxID=5762 RepID=D2VT69_NAEGR|nr:XPG domain-containing protein [Naegleria gruberi]EFC40095.1 XPG domain-containing protein [Naegleria gruberi]|eukprot:XP_002672839.1 XPG domain-containing protein [Naegleria gruberi strain NEG-M]